MSEEKSTIKKLNEQPRVLDNGKAKVTPPTEVEGEESNNCNFICADPL